MKPVLPYMKLLLHLSLLAAWTVGTVLVERSFAEAQAWAALASGVLLAAYALGRPVRFMPAKAGPAAAEQFVQRSSRLIWGEERPSEEDMANEVMRLQRRGELIGDFGLVVAGSAVLLWTFGVPRSFVFMTAMAATAIIVCGHTVTGFVQRGQGPGPLRQQ